MKTLLLFACWLLVAAAETTESAPKESAPKESAPKESAPKESASLEVARRNISGELVLNNGLAWGTWGQAEYCERGSFVYAFEIKYEDYSTVDDTGVNGVKLYCRNLHDHDTGYVTSTIGQYGDWQGMRICSSGFMTGMRANVLEPQGVFKDDVAVENLQMRCRNGTETHTGYEGTPSFPLGKWSAWTSCRDVSLICGLSLRYEEPVVADDSGITDIIMYCCY